MAKKATADTQGLSEEEDRSMTKIYGICPEMMIDGYRHVVDSLLAEAYRHAGLASELFNTARSKEQAYDTARKTLIAQSDELRPRFDALQQQEESK